MRSELLDRLRRDLDAAHYRVSAVRALLGPDADAARARGIFAQARFVLAQREASELASLIRLFLLGESLGGDEIDRALPRLGRADALGLGLIENAEDTGDSGGSYRASLSLNPIELTDPLSVEADAIIEWYLLSDLDDQLRRGPARPDHVMGVGGATRSLLAQAPLGGSIAAPASALDLGTGCGIVALYLARAGTARIVATDISQRALDLAGANARLNDLADRIEFRRGDLFETVRGERFELILSNPPFVITPRERDGGEAPRYEYRDGGMTGDELAEKVAREGPAYLQPGGSLLCLANWEARWGEDGLERVRAWIEASSLTATLDAAWVIERDRVSPAQYAETWARDGGARPGDAEFEELMSAWIEDFSRRKIISIGLGAIRVRVSDASEASETPATSLSPVLRLEHASGTLAMAGLAGGLATAFNVGVEAARMSDAEMLSIRWVRADNVCEEREYEPGAEDPRSICLVTDMPIGRRLSVDPVLAAATGACDGDLTLAQLSDALATLLEADASALTRELVRGVRELAWFGMLAPAAT